LFCFYVLFCFAVAFYLVPVFSDFNDALSCFDLVVILAANLFFVFLCSGAPLSMGLLFARWCRLSEDRS